MLLAVDYCCMHAVCYTIAFCYNSLMLPSVACCFYLYRLFCFALCLSCYVPCEVHCSSTGFLHSVYPLPQLILDNQ